jgi:DNA-binding transcriptional MerR regulator/methylmalonyl-CoA mutase cobalamin-binding subunit
MARQKPTYSLGAVCRLTGLSPHVLRAWERRYGAVSPGRSPGGTRRYSERDIARLQLLAAGVQAGHRIGDLAELPDREIRSLLETPAAGAGPPLQRTIEALARLDSAEVERLLGLQLAALGPSEFASKVALPLLGEIGDRWSSGKLCVAAEHLGSASLRGFLGVAMRAQPNGAGPPVLFATPAGERHELGVMIAAVFAQSCGVRAYYFGPDLPADQIVWAASEIEARAVALGIMTLPNAKLSSELGRLRRELPEDVEVWVGGVGAQKAKLPDGTYRLADLDKLKARLDLLKAQTRA